MARFNRWTLTPDGWAKYCNGCGRVRTEHQYNRDASTYSGFKSRCAECVNRATSRASGNRKNNTKPLCPTPGMSAAEREARAIAKLDREIAVLFGDFDTGTETEAA